MKEAKVEDTLGLSSKVTEYSNLVSNQNNLEESVEISNQAFNMAQIMNNPNDLLIIGLSSFTIMLLLVVIVNTIGLKSKLKNIEEENKKISDMLTESLVGIQDIKNKNN